MPAGEIIKEPERFTAQRKRDMQRRIAALCREAQILMNELEKIEPIEYNTNK